MDHAFIARIHRLIDAAGGQSALARKSGLSLGAIQRYMKGGEPTRGALMRLAETCAVSLSWLVYGDDATPSDLPAPGHRHAPGVPVYGFAECGLQGWYNESRLHITTSFEWPDPETFAVIASGHSMAPEGIHPGFFCIASPNTKARRGDAVVIRKTDGTATIKLYQQEDNAWLVVTGWLDPEKPGLPQQAFTDQILRKSIMQIAPVIMVRRRS